MTRRLTYFCIFSAILLLLLSFTGPAFANGQPTWISIIPPLIAVGLAFATHNIYISLISAVLVGGPLYFLNQQEGVFTSLYKGAGYASTKAFSSLVDPVNLQILTFAGFILIMIGVIQGAKGFTALAHQISGLAKTKKRTQLMTYIMGFFVFIDDYASTMIVGSSMRPLADKVKLSRQKLAFVVDATSAPIAGLAIVSTWIGYEVGLFNEISKSLSLGQNGYAMFFDAISYRFYCFFMLIFILFNIFTGIDFGKMKEFEDQAEKRPAPTTNEGTDLKLGFKNSLVAIIPFFSLLIFLFYSLWLDGKGPDLMTSGSDLFSLTYWRDVLSQSENNILILAQSATLGLVLSVVAAIVLGSISFAELFRALLAGVRKALIPVVILVLAWSLKSVCDDLQTGNFLAGALGDIIKPALFPLALFILSSVIAFSTGTSWGTMAILIPTAIPLAFYLDGDTYGLITMISLGSILDGAIFGDHCSPISDTTILSSMSTECPHMEHVSTQLPYALTVGAIAVVFGYLPAGFDMPWLLSMGLAIASYIVLFGYLKKKRAAAA